MSRIENGHNEPSLDVLKKLMGVFEVSADFLINDEWDPVIGNIIRL